VLINFEREGVISTRPLFCQQHGFEIRFVIYNQPMLAGSMILTVMFAAAVCATPHAQTRSGPEAAKPPIRACALLPASEVKRLAALPDPANLFDMMPPEEQPAGAGSSCNYPGIHVQIDPFGWTTIESVRAKNSTQFEAVSGVGDAAFVRANKAASSIEFAELYARVGPHILTIQMDVPDGKSTASVKPGLVALAQAYIAKLR
jgi:hypothetical protein